MQNYQKYELKAIGNKKVRNYLRYGCRGIESMDWKLSKT